MQLHSNLPKVALLSLLALAFLFPNFSQPTRALAVWGDIYIENAGYTDADGDGLADDVVVDIYIKFAGYDGSYLINYQFYPILTLPSGASYSYGFDVTTNYVGLVFHLTMLNHATETGDYTLEVHLVHHFSARWAAYTYQDIIFDPPGGQDNSDPPGLICSVSSW